MKDKKQDKKPTIAPVGDPPVPNRAHTEMKCESEHTVECECDKDKKGKKK